jgi:biofilm PGA synthesis protein PgaD
VLVALPLMLLCASVLLISWAEYNRAASAAATAACRARWPASTRSAADLGASTGLAERLDGLQGRHAAHG